MKTEKAWQNYQDPDLCSCRHCKSFVWVRSMYLVW